MTEITVLELHLHDASFTANAPKSGVTGGESSKSGRRLLGGRNSDDESGTVAADADSGGTSPLPKLLAFGAIIVVSLLARRLMSGEKEPVPA